MVASLDPIKTAEMYLLASDITDLLRDAPQYMSEDDPSQDSSPVLSRLNSKAFEAIEKVFSEDFGPKSSNNKLMQGSSAEFSCKDGKVILTVAPAVQGAQTFNVLAGGDNVQEIAQHSITSTPRPHDDGLNFLAVPATQVVCLLKFLSPEIGPPSKTTPKGRF